MPTKLTSRKLSDYTLDPTNPNKGHERSASIVEQSIDKFGAARSGVADKSGVIRAGNHTAESLYAAGITDVIEVETDGTAWVVVKRTDWTEDQARAYSVADNRSSQFVSWSADVLNSMASDGIDLTWLWSEQEFDQQFKQLANDTNEALSNGTGGGSTSTTYPLTFDLTEQERDIVDQALARVKVDNKTISTDVKALIHICMAYLDSE